MVSLSVAYGRPRVSCCRKTLSNEDNAAGWTLGLQLVGIGNRYPRRNHDSYLGLGTRLAYFIT